VKRRKKQKKGALGLTTWLEKRGWALWPARAPARARNAGWLDYRATRRDITCLVYNEEHPLIILSVEQLVFSAVAGSCGLR
jgi:hypothetical protein